MCLTKVIYWNQAKFGADAEKYVSYDAKKTFVEVTQLLESVLEQASKSRMIGLTYEALKTSTRCRRCVKSKKGARCWRSHRSTARRTGRMTTTT